MSVPTQEGVAPAIDSSATYSARGSEHWVEFADAGREAKVAGALQELFPAASWKITDDKVTIPLLQLGCMALFGASSLEQDADYNVLVANVPSPAKCIDILHYLLTHDLSTTKVESITEWKERVNAVVTSIGNDVPQELMVLKSDWIINQPPAGEFHHSVQWLTHVSLSDMLGHGSPQLFAPLAEFNLYSGGHFVRKDISTASTFVGMVQGMRSILAVNSESIPAYSANSAFDSTAGPLFATWMTEQAWESHLDKRTWTMSMATRLADFDDLVGIVYKDEKPLKARRVVKARFMQVCERHLPSLLVFMAGLISSVAFELYVRLHTLWGGASDPLDLDSMRIVDNMAKSTATKSILAQKVDANTPSSQVLHLEAHSKAFEKADVAGGSRIAGDGGDATSLTYSAANSVRVRKAMESEAFPRYKLLLSHLQDDNKEDHKELKALRLLLSAATSKYGGVFPDSPQASQDYKKGITADGSDFPALEPLTLLRQRVLAKRKTDRVHDEIFVFVDQSAKKLASYVTRYTYFGEDLGIGSEMYQLVSASLNDSKVIVKLSKGLWRDFHLVNDVVNVLRGLANSCTYEECPEGEEFITLRYLLLMQKFVPRLFASVGMALKGKRSLQGQLQLSLDIVLDSEVLREDIAVDLLDKTQQRMAKAFALGQEAWKDAVWCDDPLAAAMTEFLPASTTELDAMSDEIATTLKNFRMWRRIVPSLFADIDGSSVGSGVNYWLQSYALPNLNPP